MVSLAQGNTLRKSAFWYGIFVKDYELNPKSEVNPESWTQPKGSLQNQSPCFMDIIILSLCQLYQVSHFYFLIHFST